MGRAATLERPNTRTASNWDTVPAPVADLAVQITQGQVLPPELHVSVSRSETYLCPEQQLPATIRVQDISEKLERNVQADYALGLGSLAVGSLIENPDTPESTAPRIGLLDMIERAESGDPALLAENIRMTAIEALLSEGLAGEVVIERDHEGQLHQNGQRLYDVLANTIQIHPGDHPGLHRLAQAEALNHYVFDMLDKSGYFDQGYVWVIPGLAPKDTPAGSIRQYGFFENIAMTWRVISKEAPGRFKMRSMFVAGAEIYDHEEASDRTMTDEELDAMYQVRLERRHDFAGAQRVYERLGLAVPEDELGYLRGFLRHRSQFDHPDHPEADLARYYDEALGPDFFLGKKGPGENYVANGERRAAALRGLAEQTPKIVDELIKMQSQFATHMDAAYELARIVKRYAVDYMIDNKAAREVLGTRVLGLAAHHLFTLYDQMPSGQSDRTSIREKIHKQSRANTCGFGDGKKSSKGWDNDSVGSDSGGTQAEDRDEESGESTEACVVDTKNCYCCSYKVDGTPLIARITVKALIDKGKMSCLRPGCGAWVTSDGKFKGKIWMRAQGRAHQEEHAPRPAKEPPVKDED